MFLLIRHDSTHDFNRGVVGWLWFVPPTTPRLKSWAIRGLVKVF